MGVLLGQKTEIPVARFGHGLGMVWAWFGQGLGKVWAWFGHGWGMVGAQ